MFLQTKKKIYEFKIGLKGLILYQEKANLSATEDINFLIYCGLITQHPDITFQEIEEIVAECDLRKFRWPPKNYSTIEIEELYKKAVGEIGITPSDFFKMTPEEIDLAYEGYLRRKETEANLTKLAFITSNDGALIRLTEDYGYEIGNIAEREETFKILNIREGLE